METFTARQDSHLSRSNWWPLLSWWALLVLYLSPLLSSNRIITLSSLFSAFRTASRLTWMTVLLCTERQCKSHNLPLFHVCSHLRIWIQRTSDMCVNPLTGLCLFHLTSVVATWQQPCFTRDIQCAVLMQYVYLLPGMQSCVTHPTFI